jgi:hypothetical protein
MVALTALWLPILLSAVFVFIMSSLIHMVFKWHKADYKSMPGEDAVMEVMRKQGLEPGTYVLPHCTDMSAMKSPEMLKKYEAGPVGFFNVMPSGPPAMSKRLVQWFVWTLVVGLFVAYLTGRFLGPGAEYLAVFRLAGTTAFLAYAVGEPVASIWKAQPWGATARHILDGLLYSLLTAGTFGWLWPA